MLKHMLTSALFAGAAAGLLAAVLHFAFVQNYILLSEKYESGEMTHFAGVSVAGADDDQTAAASGHAAMAGMAGASAQGQGAEATEEGSITRNGLTVLFKILVFVGYGMLLVAGFAIAERYGHKITARQGLLWGIAGFAAFQMVPGLGMAPTLPGTPGTDIDARQIWWLGTAVSTAVALALVAYGNGVLAYVAALVIAIIPHVIGAPELGYYAGVAPPEVGGTFAARTLGTGLLAWAALGWLSGRLWGGAAA